MEARALPAAPLNDNGYGDLRVLIGGKADEHTVVGGVLADLGGTGLGTGRDNTILEVTGQATLGGQVVHALFYRGKGRDGNIHLGEELRLMLIEDGAAVIGGNGFQQVGIQPLAPPDQGGNIAGQLEGG